MIMGWNIALVDNTVELSEACAKALFEIGGDYDLWAEIEELQIDDTRYQLYFNKDYMENMDYLHREDILAILLKFKVNGDVTFTSHEGDNIGQSWGYRFKDGVLTKLVGQIIFTEFQN